MFPQMLIDIEPCSKHDPAMFPARRLGKNDFACRRASHPHERRITGKENNPSLAASADCNFGRSLGIAVHCRQLWADFTDQISRLLAFLTNQFVEVRKPSGYLHRDEHATYLRIRLDLLMEG